MKLLLAVIPEVSQLSNEDLCFWPIKKNRIHEVVSYWCFSYENVTYFLNISTVLTMANVIKFLVCSFKIVSYFTC